MVLDVEAQQEMVEKEMIVYEHFGTVKKSMKSQDMNSNQKV